VFRTLRGRVIATYFVVVVISLLLASLFFLFFLSRYTRDRERKDLIREVIAIAKHVKKLSDGQPASPVRARQANPDSGVVLKILNAESEISKVKLLLIASDGTVIVESKARPVFGNRAIKMPEGIFSETGPRITERYFKRFGKNYLFATAPSFMDSSPVFLMAIKPVEEIGLVAGALVGYVAVAGLIAMGISMLLALYLSGALSRPIREATAAARKMSAGDYSAEVPVRGSDETAELARDFNMMAERVRAAYELQREFVGNVSHELRTPLTSIEGFSQALLDGVTKSESERNRSLEIINQESKRLVRVLRDMLLLSQIDAGGLRSEKRQVDLVDLMRKLENVYGMRAESDGQVFRVDPPAEGLTIFTDADRLERILTNLLDNAFKYTNANDTVTLSAGVSDTHVQISVADSGPGIPPDALANIFDRFYRVDKSRSLKHSGAGLGLSICKELAGTLGGDIKVWSLLGHGTTFTVTLPIS